MIKMQTQVNVYRVKAVMDMVKTHIHLTCQDLRKAQAYRPTTESLKEKIESLKLKRKQLNQYLNQLQIFFKDPKQMDFDPVQKLKLIINEYQPVNIP